MAAEMHVSILGRCEIIREGLRRILTDQGIIVDATSSSSADCVQPLCDMSIVDAQGNLGRHPVLHRTARALSRLSNRSYDGPISHRRRRASICYRSSARRLPREGDLLRAPCRRVAPDCYGTKDGAFEMASSLPHALPQFMWSVRGNRLAEMPRVGPRNGNTALPDRWRPEQGHLAPARYRGGDGESAHQGNTPEA